MSGAGRLQGTVPAAAWNHDAVSQADQTRTMLATAGSTVVLAGAAALGPAELLGAIALAQALLIVIVALMGAPPAPAPDGSASNVIRPGRAAPTGGAALPGRIGAMIIGGLAAVGADVAVSLRPHDALSPVLFVLGLAVPAMFVHQLTRGVVRSRVVESVSGIAVVVVSVVALTALVQLRHESDGATLAEAAIWAVGLAVAVASFVDLVWSHPRYDVDVPRGFTATVLGTAAGTSAGTFALRDLGQFTTGRALVLCGICAVAGAVVAVVVGFIAQGLSDSPTDPTVRRVRPVAFGILPLALVAPAAYVVLLSG